MDLNSIVALAQAGFTREQIYQLANAPQPQPQPMQPQVMPQMQQPLAAPQVMPQMQQPVVAMQMPQMQQPVAAPQVIPQMQQPQMVQQLPDGSGAFVATTPAEPPKQDPFMMLFEQMTGIKKAIQDSNIQNSQIGSAEPQNTDDILASIIQPTKPKEEK